MLITQTPQWEFIGFGFSGFGFREGTVVLDVSLSVGGLVGCSERHFLIW